ncbi:hypothetical protein Rhow_002425 [Rhodococcus wratislaviensis]|uniref:Uncharacterized protein n=1 Tax=Rhodococcus wratislaviensis TaxID=44752 RepID=A0A402C5M4_RHOWR|nr:hypothetical protein Rhow_002425 [Rhodococcus wratislaviensis]
MPCCVGHYENPDRPHRQPGQQKLAAVPPSGASRTDFLYSRTS